MVLLVDTKGLHSRHLLQRLNAFPCFDRSLLFTGTLTNCWPLCRVSARKDKQRVCYTIVAHATRGPASHHTYRTARASSRDDACTAWNALSAQRRDYRGCTCAV